MLEEKLPDDEINPEALDELTNNKGDDDDE